MAKKSQNNALMKYFLRQEVILSFALLLIIFIIYYIYSLRFVGPAYLSDEISYLTKAAAVAGHNVDAASSWYAGYSILLAPIFLITNNPETAWRGVLILNAALFSASFGFLIYLLRSIFKQTKFLYIILVVCLSALYPSWISMSGYAFSTPGLVFFYSLSVLLLYKSLLKPGVNTILFALSTSYLYWIHPTGLIVAAVSIALLLAKQEQGEMSQTK